MRQPVVQSADGKCSENDCDIGRMNTGDLQRAEGAVSADVSRDRLRWQVVCGGGRGGEWGL